MDAEAGCGLGGIEQTIVAVAVVSLGVEREQAINELAREGMDRREGRDDCPTIQATDAVTIAGEVAKRCRRWRHESDLNKDRGVTQALQQVCKHTGETVGFTRERRWV
jgi:hypothetical protein